MTMTKTIVHIQYRCPIQCRNIVNWRKHLVFPPDAGLSDAAKRCALTSTNDTYTHMCMHTFFFIFT